jgi:hypothetical protein
VNFLHFLREWKALTHLLSAAVVAADPTWAPVVPVVVRITPPTLQQIQQM